MANKIIASHGHFNVVVVAPARVLITYPKPLRVMNVVAAKFLIEDLQNAVQSAQQEIKRTKG